MLGRAARPSRVYGVVVVDQRQLCWAEKLAEGGQP